MSWDFQVLRREVLIQMGSWGGLKYGHRGPKMGQIQRKVSTTSIKIVMQVIKLKSCKIPQGKNVYGWNTLYIDWVSPFKNLWNGLLFLCTDIYGLDGLSHGAHKVPLQICPIKNNPGNYLWKTPCYNKSVANRLILKLKVKGEYWICMSYTLINVISTHTYVFINAWPAE